MTMEVKLKRSRISLLVLGVLGVTMLAGCNSDSMKDDPAVKAYKGPGTAKGGSVPTTKPAGGPEASTSTPKADGQ